MEVHLQSVNVPLTSLKLPLILQHKRSQVRFVSSPTKKRHPEDTTAFNVLGTTVSAEFEERPPLV